MSCVRHPALGQLGLGPSPQCCLHLLSSPQRPHSRPLQMESSSDVEHLLTFARLFRRFCDPSPAVAKSPPADDATGLPLSESLAAACVRLQSALEHREAWSNKGPGSLEVPHFYLRWGGKCVEGWRFRAYALVWVFKRKLSTCAVHTPGWITLAPWEPTCIALCGHRDDSGDVVMELCFLFTKKRPRPRGRVIGRGEWDSCPSAHKCCICPSASLPRRRRHAPHEDFPKTVKSGERSPPPM